MTRPAGSRGAGSSATDAPGAAELTLAEFERRYRELLSGKGEQAEGSGCVQCDRCTGCIGCTFCKDSERLVRCHFSVTCVGCTDCSHCRESKNLIGCQHCTLCEGCSACSYLVRSTGCTDCSYCFGCVGLSRRDFCILNQPYSREAYFALSRRLMHELGLG